MTELSVSAPPGNPRFPLVDSVRALAMLSVFGLHLGVAAGGLENAWYRPVVARLDIGVTLFFLISGFLLYRPFAAARIDGRRAPSLRRYTKGRLLRIVPAYWLALALLAVYPGLPQMWDHAWAYFLFVQQYIGDRVAGGLLQAWSLGVELAFYAVLPLIALGLRALPRGPSRARRIRTEVLIIGGLALAAILFRALVGSSGGMPQALPDVTPANPEITPGHSRFVLLPGTVFTGLPGSFDWFALGMLLAVISVGVEGREDRFGAMRAIARRPGLCWAAALGVFAAAAVGGLVPAFPEPLSRGAWLAATLVYGLVSLLVLAPAVLGTDGKGLPRRVMGNRALAWLGAISYGCFLWHVAILGKLGELDVWGSHRMLGMGVVALALTVCAATLSYYLLEQPLLRLRDRGVARG